MPIDWLTVWLVKMCVGQKPLLSKLTHKIQVFRTIHNFFPCRFMQQGTTLPGDILLVTAFISYVGCFTKQFRVDLLTKNWLPYLRAIEPPVPITEGIDPLKLLTDDTTIAIWQNESLPSDRMSIENATILTNSDRWPLMIDPQLQGVKWIKQKYGSDLIVMRIGQKGYVEKIEEALIKGSTVLIENIGENLDPVLDSLLGRNLIKKGKAVKLGDKEVEYNSTFRLILHTKLANPHYKPEMQAQTTLINFTVTRDGLEDQLLAEVVKAERPDLEELKADLTKQQNDFKILLNKLEDDLLSRLSSAGDNVLGDTALVENLETTKKTAAEIEEKVRKNLFNDFWEFKNSKIPFSSHSTSSNPFIFEPPANLGVAYSSLITLDDGDTARTRFESVPFSNLNFDLLFQVAEAKITSKEIDEARELYRPAAARASLLYFILNELNTINPIYQFSLKVREINPLGGKRH